MHDARIEKQRVFIISVSDFSGVDLVYVFQTHEQAMSFAGDRRYAYHVAERDVVTMPDGTRRLLGSVVEP